MWDSVRILVVWKLLFPAGAIGEGVQTFDSCLGEWVEFGPKQELGKGIPPQTHSTSKAMNKQWRGSVG